MAPGPDPLNGAHFFVDGPAPGRGRRARSPSCVGLNPKSLPVDESWARFQQQLRVRAAGRAAGHQPGPGPPGRRAVQDRRPARGPAHQHLLRGRRPGRDLRQTEKILCTNMTADPGRSRSSTPTSCIPTLVAAPPRPQCSAYNADVPAPDQRDGRRHRPPARGVPARARRARLLGLHQPARARCPAWEADLRYEINTFAGASAHRGLRGGRLLGLQLRRLHRRILNAIGVSKIRGFFTNDTHQQLDDQRGPLGDRRSPG